MAARSYVCRDNRGRAGFTIVELLVVITIIGVMMAMALPALSSVRELMNETKCAGNLRSIGYALDQYHVRRQRYPVGCLEFRGGRRGGGKKQRQLAWSVFILPYLDRRPLYESLDIDKPFDSKENAEAAATVVSTYLCPSADRDGPLIDGRAACDYGGVAGERINGPNNPMKGVLIYDKPIKKSQIEDGAQYTLVVGEDSGWKDGQWINGRNVLDQSGPINRWPKDKRKMENELRSHHLDGAMGLFADSSVRFLFEDMDVKVVAAICTRAGGEPPPDLEPPLE